MNNERLPKSVTCQEKHSRTSSMDDLDQYDPLLNGVDDGCSKRDERRTGALLPRRFLILTGSLLLFTLLSFILGSINIITLSSVGNITRKASYDIAAMRVKLETGNLRPSSSQATGNEFGSCGRSITEARELGCIFDPMSWAWQRPECYHADLVTDFLRRMDWHFYLSNETLPTEEVPREEWERGDHTLLWGPRMWHNFHCTYSWRKFHEAFRHQMPMDNDILQVKHTLHCDGVFLHDYDPRISAPCDNWPGGCQTTELHAGFNHCGWY
ncbi:hypothetical protein N7504_008337 [Penicillium tannophilum]|nr:hypothetical protein N7504_008337 [Penicillium tannophilum]